jgi:ABC-type lipoprotein export system ATPase subunit
VFLITEQNYEKYTKDESEKTVEQKIESLSDEQNLINTMTVYEKWVYLLFKKDIR